MNNERAKELLRSIKAFLKANTSFSIDQTFKNRDTPKPVSWVRTAQGFDKTILIAAWPGVMLQLDEKRDFKGSWKALMDLLLIFD